MILSGDPAATDPTSPRQRVETPQLVTALYRTGPMLFLCLLTYYHTEEGLLQCIIADSQLWSGQILYLLAVRRALKDGEDMNPGSGRVCPSHIQPHQQLQ